MKEIEKAVVEILEELSMSEISDLSKTLVGDLALDSLCMVMLLVTLEEIFKIELDESDMNPFALNTVQDVVELAKKYVGGEHEKNS